MFDFLIQEQPASTPEPQGPDAISADQQPGHEPIASEQASAEPVPLEQGPAERGAAEQVPTEPTATEIRTEQSPAEQPSEQKSSDQPTVDETSGEVVPFPAAQVEGDKPRSTRIFAIANQKGGVGKTTTAINLGTALAATGERVLVIDLDPQGNASTGLGIDRKNRRLTSYDVVIGTVSLSDAILATAVPHLSIVPATIDLAGADLEISRMRDRAFRLRQALTALMAEAPDGDAFTYVLVDCPPSLNLLTINAMAAAHAVLVPLQCEFLALEGLSQLLKTIDQVKTTLNPALAIHGIVLTMYDSRNNLSDQVVADVREFMGSQVYNTVIPRNVRVSEAPSYGKPVLVYDLKCAGSEAYLRLASEVIQREKELTDRLAG
jgi:chromosome partitioning protein